MCAMLRSMSARFCAPHTVVTSPTAMYGSMIAMAGEHPGAVGALSRRASGERRRRDPRRAVDLRDAHRDLVDEAPRPVLARLDRAHDRVIVAPGVRARVAVGRAVAAADVAALEADAQMGPSRAHAQAGPAAVDGPRQFGGVGVVGGGGGGHPG